MALIHGTIVFATVLLHETALVLARSQDPFGKYGSPDPDNCGASHSSCWGDLPDCCSGHEDGYYIEWCCDKNVWRYFVYGALSLCVALFWVGFMIWYKYPDCFNNTFGRVWGWIVSCFTCSWIRRNFVDDNQGTYQTIE